MKVNGSCHCGQIIFKAEVSKEAVICHCTDCQVLSGSAFRVNVKAPVSKFKILKGELKSYCKIAENGDNRIHTFCSTCSTPIYSSQEIDPQFFFIRIGAIKERSELVPTVQIWQRSTLNNFSQLDCLLGSPEQQALS